VTEPLISADSFLERFAQLKAVQHWDLFHVTVGNEEKVPSFVTFFMGRLSNPVKPNKQTPDNYLANKRKV